MKKFLATGATLVLALSVIACSKEETPSESQNEAPVSQEKSVGINIQIGESEETRSAQDVGVNIQVGEGEE